MLKLSRERTAFGRHETFPLRHAWLTKGAEAILAYPTIFSEPERAMVELGVGRNMVSAMQYWLQVTGLAAFHDALARLTPLGETILGDAGDPYLEDEATLWIIHWLIASNAELATGFFWFFNRFAMPRFGEPELRQTLTDFVERELSITRAQTTLKSDLSTLLRLYAPASPRGAGEPAANKGGGARRQRLGEEQLDALLAGLRLIEHEPGPGGGYRSPRRARPYLPPIALAFALAERFAAEPEMPALPIRQLLYGDPNTLGWAAPGAVFRLSEDGFMAVLAHVMERWPGCYELRDTAGVHQLYRLGNPQDAQALLAEYYHRNVL